MASNAPPPNCPFIAFHNFTPNAIVIQTTFPHIQSSCVRFWPETGSATYGKLKITATAKPVEKNDTVKRKFEISFDKEKTNIAVSNGEGERERGREAEREGEREGGGGGREAERERERGGGGREAERERRIKVISGTIHLAGIILCCIYYYLNQN